MVSVSLDAVMNDLRAKLSGVLESFDRNKRVMYLDYPVHRNVGDLLINIGTEQFFKENNIHVWRRYSIWDFPYHLPRIDPDVTVICHGGGNFGDIWTEYQKWREAIFEKYANNRVVVLPQTVYFGSAEIARASIGKIGKHRNYHIYGRDQKSVDTLRSAGLSEVSVMPDMAHALWGVLPTPPNPQEHRAFLLMRTDVESTSLPEEYKRECASLKPYDWLTIISPLARVLGRLTGGIIRREARVHLDIQKDWQWYPVRDMAIRSSLDFFSNYSTIYTNRLHGMILGVLLRKQVIAFDNSYGKLSGYYGTWLSECNEIKLVRS